MTTVDVVPASSAGSSKPATAATAITPAARPRSAGRSCSARSTPSRATGRAPSPVANSGRETDEEYADQLHLTQTRVGREPATSTPRPAAATAPRIGTARRAAVGGRTSSNSGTGSSTRSPTGPNGQSPRWRRPRRLDHQRTDWQRSSRSRRRSKHHRHRLADRGEEAKGDQRVDAAPGDDDRSEPRTFVDLGAQRHPLKVEDRWPAEDPPGAVMMERWSSRSLSPSRSRFRSPTASTTPPTRSPRSSPREPRARRKR